eukprot:8747163-Pyramimonas_sp.AAC.1
MPGAPPWVSRAWAREDAWAEYVSWGRKSKSGGTNGDKDYGKGGVYAAEGAGKGSGGKGAENLALWKCEHCQC